MSTYQTGYRAGQAEVSQNGLAEALAVAEGYAPHRHTNPFYFGFRVAVQVAFEKEFGNEFK